MHYPIYTVYVGLTYQLYSNTITVYVTAMPHTITENYQEHR